MPADTASLSGSPAAGGPCHYSGSSSAALIRSIAASISRRSPVRRAPVRRARSSISRTSIRARSSGETGAGGEAGIR